ncbi:MAG: hypothetical protein HRT61_12465, partial [Ekhidna sp.]|nr:hypothetical protein [Ekhidna sp.]
MKILILTISFLNLHPICGQSVSIEKFEQIGLSKEEVNAEAYRQLIQDFYWSTNDETAPFGNETGLETFYLFKEWRQENEQEGPLVFLSDLIAGWDLSAFDLSELDEDKIRKYLQVHSHNSRTKTLEDMPAHT